MIERMGRVSGGREKRGFDNTMIEMVISSLAIYLAIGVIFTIAFLFAGMRRVDPITQGASIGFRVLSLPGCTLLWPILLIKWVRA